MSSIAANHHELVLYGTVGCHLCELAEQQLMPYVASGWQVALIDIVDNDELFERFSLIIPVLQCSASGRLLCWPFDAAMLHDFLADRNPE